MGTIEVHPGGQITHGAGQGARMLATQIPSHDIQIIKSETSPPVFIHWPVRNNGSGTGYVVIGVTSSKQGWASWSGNIKVSNSASNVDAFHEIRIPALQMSAGETRRFFAQLYDNTNGQLNTILSGHHFDVTFQGNGGEIIVNTLPAGSVFFDDPGDGVIWQSPDGNLWQQRFDGRWLRL